MRSNRRHSYHYSQPTINCTNKQQKTPIVSAPPRRCVSWSDMHSFTMFDVDRSPSQNPILFGQMHLRNIDNEKTKESLVIPPLPFGGGPSDDDTRETRRSVKPILLGRAHLTSRVNQNDDYASDEVVSIQMSTAQSPSKMTTSSLLPGYTIGQAPKHRRHMVIPTTLEAGIEYASTLRPLDCAFVLRGNGYWVYGIVCNVNGPNGEGQQPSIRFALDTHGSTKTISKKNWGHKIRLINLDHK